MPLRRLALTALLLAPLTAQANPPLGDVTVVTEGLIAAAIAYEIGDKCDGLDARLVAGINFLQGLKNHAEGLGYSSRDIEAFIDDDAEADRLEAVARARLSAMGGVTGQWETYCAVGQAEIAVGSQIGRLLR